VVGHETRPWRSPVIGHKPPSARMAKRKTPLEQAGGSTLNLAPDVLACKAECVYALNPVRYITPRTKPDGPAAVVINNPGATSLQVSPHPRPRGVSEMYSLPAVDSGLARSAREANRGSRRSGDACSQLPPARSRDAISRRPSQWGRLHR
jgi:hypothetical protein